MDINKEMTVHLSYEELLAAREVLRRANQEAFLSERHVLVEFASRPFFTAFKKLDDAAKIARFADAIERASTEG